MFLTVKSQKKSHIFSQETTVSEILPPESSKKSRCLVNLNVSSGWAKLLAVENRYGFLRPPALHFVIMEIFCGLCSTGERIYIYVLYIFCHHHHSPASVFERQKLFLSYILFVVMVRVYLVKTSMQPTQSLPTCKTLSFNSREERLLK